MFRSDLEYNFDLCGDTLRDMVNELHGVLQFGIEGFFLSINLFFRIY